MRRDCALICQIEGEFKADLPIAVSARSLAASAIVVAVNLARDRQSHGSRNKKQEGAAFAQTIGAFR